MIRRSKMIFRDVEYCLEWVKEQKLEIDVEKNKSSYEQFALLEKDLKMINSYIISGEWLVRQEAKQKIKRVLETNYNYKTVADEYDVSEDAIRTFVSYCNQKVKEKIGEDTIDLLLKGKRAVALVQYETLKGNYSIRNLYTQNIEDMLPSPKTNAYRLEDCKDELEFLYIYSNEHMLKLYEKCDSKKLAHILSYLENSVVSEPYERFGVVRLLTGNGQGVEEMLEKIEQSKA